MLSFVDSAAHLRPYVRLLAVHLFAIMDEGERLLDSGRGEEIPGQLLQQREEAARWLALLLRLDSELDGRILSLLGREDRDGRPVENLINAAAQILMDLDECYEIFADPDLTANTEPSPPKSPDPQGPFII